MLALLSAEQMRRLDRLAIEQIGIPSLVLMETAGCAVADAVEGFLEDADTEEGPVLLLCGTGNNGGDALVAARHLHNRGVEITIVVLSEPQNGSTDFKLQWEIAQKLDLPSLVLTESDPSDTLGSLLSVHEVVVDGLFGTGLSRPIGGAHALAIQTINEFQRPVIAIDLPSGVNADNGQIMGEAIEASSTVTFALPKLGHALYPGRACAGSVQVADIGIPYSLLDEVDPNTAQVDESVVELFVPEREPDSHKGNYGHLLVVAGCPQRPGAAVLAARAGMRIGTGLVTVGSCTETIRRLSPVFDELMGCELGETQIEAEQLLTALSGVTALAIGPSLSPDQTLTELLRATLLRANLPVVLDAGALVALGADPAWLRERSYPTILTPHPGEMRHLTGLDTALIQADRVGVARTWAQRWSCTVVLKGASTVIADPDGEVGIVCAGNPGMATAGTGDVLCGVIGGLLAQGVSASFAARAGAYLHAVAGDRAATETGQAGLTASDLLSALRLR